MKIVFLFVIYSVLIASVLAEPIKSLSEGFRTEWSEMKIAFAVDPGCTPIETPEELIIDRKGNNMTIYGKSTSSKGETIYTSPRDLTEKEFSQIIQKVSEFYKTAEEEIDTTEYFNSLPKKVRDAKLEEYFKTHGRPIGGFGGTYIFVQFSPKEFDSIVMNAFNEQKSYQTFIDWIRATSGSTQR